jgi:hypothetical protein
MKCLVGQISDAKNDWTWSGEGGSFSHTARFSLGAQKVRLDTTSRPQNEEGDRIVVAGPVRGGELRALAYKNLSSGVQGESGYVSALLVGICLLLAALPAITPAPLLAAALAAVGAALLMHSRRIWAALQALESAA